MTKYYRCVKCELEWEEREFAPDQFCNTCNRQIENSNERRRYRSIFSHYAQEIFYIRYPKPNHSWVTIPSDDEGKAKIIEKAKKNLATGLNREKTNKEHMEKNNNTSDQVYKDTVSNIAQMEQMTPLIVNLEQRYCKK